MKPAEYYVVLVTAPNLETARQIAQAVLSQHLAACVNILPQIESHYWWQGQLEHSAEVLLILKTAKPRLSQLQACVLGQHPYSTPEFVAMPIEHGSQAYLDWLGLNTQPA